MSAERARCPRDCGNSWCDYGDGCLRKEREAQNDPWGELRRHWNESAAKQPDYSTPEEAAQLLALMKAYEALRALGWSDAIYCPKDRTVFLSISAGSTGVHPCHYEGEWPDGSWWVHDAGDLWPGHPILWKPMPEAKP